MPEQRKLLCALVIGHKRQSPGAINEHHNLTEFAFNDKLAQDIEAKQTDVTIQRVYRRTYKSLPDDINELSPDFVVSLHCNAFDHKASGTEVLYYHHSQTGAEIADILCSELVAGLELRNRGAKPRSAEDRGGYLLRYTKAPCVIAEPFFIDNDKDVDIVRQRRSKLVKAYLKGINQIGQYLLEQQAPASLLEPLMAATPE